MKFLVAALVALAFIPNAASTGKTEPILKVTEKGSIPVPIATIGTTENGGYKGPMIVYSKDGKACDLAAFTKAANDLAEFLSVSDDPMISADIYRTPAAQLRHEADRMDARDAAIRAFRAQLDKCGWMAEPGAFDR